MKLYGESERAVSQIVRVRTDSEDFGYVCSSNAIPPAEPTSTGSFSSLYYQAKKEGAFDHDMHTPPFSYWFYQGRHILGVNGVHPAPKFMAYYLLAAIASELVDLELAE